MTNTQAQMESFSLLQNLKVEQSLNILLDFVSITLTTTTKISSVDTY